MFADITFTDVAAVLAFFGLYVMAGILAAYIMREP